MAEVLAGSRTSYHEAGHACAARALGYAVTEINFAPGPNDHPSGQVAAYVSHETAKTPFDQAVIGLAGGVAEGLKFGTKYFSFSSADLDAYRDLPADERPHAVDRTITLLQEHWSEVEELAYELYPLRPAAPDVQPKQSDSSSPAPESWFFTPPPELVAAEEARLLKNSEESK